MIKDRMDVEHEQTPIKMSETEKLKLVEHIQKVTAHLPRLNKNVEEFAIRGGRVYFYGSGTILLMRITINNEEYTDCSVDWQRRNGQWVLLENGTLEECLQKSEKGEWY